MTVQWPFPIGARPGGNIIPLVVSNENLSELENVVNLWVKQRKAEECDDSVFFNEK